MTFKEGDEIKGTGHAVVDADFCMVSDSCCVVMTQPYMYVWIDNFVVTYGKQFLILVHGQVILAWWCSDSVKDLGQHWIR